MHFELRSQLCMPYKRTKPDQEVMLQMISQILEQLNTYINRKVMLQQSHQQDLGQQFSN